MERKNGWLVQSEIYSALDSNCRLRMHQSIKVIEARTVEASWKIEIHYLSSMNL